MRCVLCACNALGRRTKWGGGGNNIQKTPSAQQQPSNRSRHICGGHLRHDQKYICVCMRRRCNIVCALANDMGGGGGCMCLALEKRFTNNIYNLFGQLQNTQRKPCRAIVYVLYLRNAFVFIWWLMGCWCLCSWVRISFSWEHLYVVLRVHCAHDSNGAL